VNIASYSVKAGDVSLFVKSEKQVRIVEALSLAEQVGMPAGFRLMPRKWKAPSSPCQIVTKSLRRQRIADRRTVLALICSCSKTRPLIEWAFS
jgi:hypothetical protein